MSFFMSFLVNIWLGLGNPCHIATKTPLEKLNKNLGLADPHPPQLGQKTKFFDRFNLKASLISPFRTVPQQKMTAQFLFFQSLPPKKPIELGVVLD